MDSYVTGSVIRKLREKNNLTQEELARRINVTGKAVSKWEMGRGYPDISLLEPLSAALGISVAELLSGEAVQNSNRSANINRGKFYICPVCGNVVRTIGEAVICCCGIKLPAVEAELPDEAHVIDCAVVEDEYFVAVSHPMTKDHYISFLASVSDQRFQFVKLYPEGNAQARFKIDRTREIYAFCNRHGLFKLKLK